MQTLYESARKATLPWLSTDAFCAGKQSIPDQQDIEVCLSCPLCASSCDYCDGKRNLSREKKGGRPRLDVDTALLSDMLTLNATHKEICSALGISEGTLRRLRNKLKNSKEENIQ